MELRKIRILIFESYSTTKINGEKEVVESKYKNGYFHCWEQYKDEYDSYVRAVIEYEDGKIERIENIESIQFIDRKPI